jgi:dihydrofolate synthase/folylpolyglutamate synthase
LHDLPPSALVGSIQYRNASTALAAVEALGSAKLELNERTVAEALRGVRLAGRFQVAQIPGVPRPGRPFQPGDPTVEWILDIAHNEPAAAIFARHVRERPMPASGGDHRGRTFAVVGILGDKDARAIATSLEPLVDQWVLCGLPGPRGTSAEQLAARLSLPSGRITLAASVEEGCAVARERAEPGDRVLVFGSVYTVGPALGWLGIY